MATFGKILADARKAKKITLRKLAQLINLSPSFLSEIERERRLPPKDEEKIRDLALVLNADQEELIEVARKERASRVPIILKKLFDTNKDLAWGLYRAAEDATNDDLEEAFQKALEILINKGDKN